MAASFDRKPAVKQPPPPWSFLLLVHVVQHALCARGQRAFAGRNCAFDHFSPSSRPFRSLSFILSATRTQRLEREAGEALTSIRWLPRRRQRVRVSLNILPPHSSLSPFPRRPHVLLPSPQHTLSPHPPPGAVLREATLVAGDGSGARRSRPARERSLCARETLAGLAMPIVEGAWGTGGCA